MVINQDFREFIESLNENKVNYLVVGGYAVAFHGNPHYTKDLDFWIQPKKENLVNLIQAIKDFGFESFGLKVEDFSDPETVVQFGYPPNRIDMLTDLQGVAFEECFEKKVVEIIDGVPINFIGIDCLKKNKGATGRHQDLADLENLQ
jgi:hypothetical protein